MRWLHTWLGLTLSALLFVIFWMGTLSLFAAEIDRWMIPELRMGSGDDVGVEAIVTPYLRTGLTQDGSVRVQLPTERFPFYVINYMASSGEPVMHVLDPSTRAVLDRTDSLAGSEFILPFHEDLHLGWKNIGLWITAIASMAMMALIVSGVFIHRRFIRDFFTIRPNKQLRRWTLDLHNHTAVIALPMHFLFPFTAIMFHMFMFFSGPFQLPFTNGTAQYAKEVHGELLVQASGEVMPFTGSIESLMATARSHWKSSGPVNRTPKHLIFRNIGDTEMNLTAINSPVARDVRRNLGRIVMNTHTGEVLHRHTPSRPQQASEWLRGFHAVLFDHWPLRWLYFLGGLSGCVMIATGALFWMQARIKKHVEPTSVRAVRSLMIGSTTGIVAATAAFFVANRLIPRDASLFAFDRSDLEVLAFFVTWVAAFGHAAFREKKAFREQALIIGALVILAVALNWITTGDHLAATIQMGLWFVAGMDLVLLAGGAIAVLSAIRLQTGGDGRDLGRRTLSRRKLETAEWS